MADDIEHIQIDIAAYAPHPRNYNEHPDPQVGEIAESLRLFGQVKPVVVWRDWYIAGHGVVLGAQRLGWTQLKAERLPADWPEYKALAYLAADNELARGASPNLVALAALAKEVQDQDAGLGRLAAGGEEGLRRLAALMGEPAGEDAGPQIDRAEELREVWGVVAGQMWQLGEHRLICGDCTDAGVVARVMGGEGVRLVVTDPPYGVGYASKNKFLNAIARGNRIQTNIEGDHGTKEDTQTLWKSAFDHMNNVMLPGAVVYCFMPQGGDQMMMMMMMMMMAGIEPRHELIWLKNNHVLGRVDYAYKHEPILYAWKDGGHKFYGDFQTSILEFPKPQQSNLHPTTKPAGLIERLVSNSSEAGDAVYDPFLGSGTTMVAAHRLGRRCFGIEIDSGYCAVTLERMSALGVTPVLVED